MKRLLIVFAFLLCTPVSIFAQCVDCQIIRGDANCDGSINMGDVIAMAGGTYSNGDAADANDDGSPNLTDSVFLAHYLFQGGAAPPCPFPGSGRDCTPDATETCCSPPPGAVTQYGSVGTVSWSFLNFGGINWDIKTVDVVAIGDGRKKGTLRVQNFNSCTHDETQTYFEEVKFPITGPSFTKKQLQKGILNISLNCPLDLTFHLNTMCNVPPDQYGVTPCDDNINKMLAVLADCEISVNIGPATASGPTASVAFNFEGIQNYEYEYKRSTFAACTLVGTSGSLTHQILFNLGINPALAAYMPTDCDEWKVFSITFEVAEFYFIRNGYKDIMQQEKITLGVFPQLLYTYCTCQ